MARTDGGLQVLPPEPVTGNHGSNERTPLLANGGMPEVSADESRLEAQAEREQREYEAGATPMADEPSTARLAATMSTLWFSTFFAALGNLINRYVGINISTPNIE